MKKEIIIRIPVIHISSSLMADMLFLISATLGVVLLFGGLFILILSSSLPPKVSGVDSTVESMVFIISQIPGIPLNLNDLANYGLTMIGLTSWILGLNVLLIGLGIWVRNKLAKWIAMGTFTFAVFFNFVNFLYLGILGAPMAFIGIFVDGLLLFLFSKLEF